MSFSYPPDDPVPTYSRPSGARVTLPAIFLILVGVVNGLFGLACFGLGTLIGDMPTAEFEKMLTDVGRDSPQWAPMLEQAVKEAGSAELLKNQAASQYRTLGIVQLVTALLTLLGGIQMLRLRMWGLALLGCIVAAIPCISPLGCCGVGEGIGIWSLIVLLDGNVKAAFGSLSAPPAEY